MSGPEILVFETAFEEKKFFMYWLDCQKRMGVFDGLGWLIEGPVTKVARAELMKVSEALADDLWIEEMHNSGLALRGVREEEADVGWGAIRTLTVKNDLRRPAERLPEVLSLMLATLQRNTGAKNLSQKSQSKASPAKKKRIFYEPPKRDKKAISPQKKARPKPRGAVFKNSDSEE